jgi:hypothetical protein
MATSNANKDHTRPKNEAGAARTTRAVLVALFAWWVTLHHIQQTFNVLAVVHRNPKTFITWSCVYFRSALHFADSPLLIENLKICSKAA